VAFARRLASAGLVTVVEDVADLAAIVALREERPPADTQDIDGRLIRDVRSYLREAVNSKGLR
jgi:hypothetical protein